MSTFLSVCGIFLGKKNHTRMTVFCIGIFSVVFKVINTVKHHGPRGSVVSDVGHLTLPHVSVVGFHSRSVLGSFRVVNYRSTEAWCTVVLIP